jgi:hypothetical protein
MIRKTIISLPFFMPKFRHYKIECSKYNIECNSYKIEGSKYNIESSSYKIEGSDYIMYTGSIHLCLFGVLPPKPPHITLPRVHYILQFNRVYKY